MGLGGVRPLSALSGLLCASNGFHGRGGVWQGGTVAPEGARRQVSSDWRGGSTRNPVVQQIGLGFRKGVQPPSPEDITKLWPSRLGHKISLLKNGRLCPAFHDLQERPSFLSRFGAG